MISIIIPALEEENYIGRLLEDICRQYEQCEVVIVDADSRDKTVEEAKKFSNRIPLKIIQSSRKSASCQRNIGARIAQGSMLVFVDADMRIPPDFLSAVRRHSADVLIPLTQIMRPNAKERILMILLKLMWQVSPKLSGRGGCLAVKKSAFIPFNEDVAVSEDVGFVMQYKNVKRLPVTVWESPRRYRKKGISMTVWFWILNGVWRTAFNKSYHNSWELVR